MIMGNANINTTIIYCKCKIFIIYGSGSRIHKIPKKRALILNDRSLPRRIGKEAMPTDLSPVMSITSFIISRGIWIKKEKRNGNIHAELFPTIPPRMKLSPVIIDTTKLPAIVFLK